MNFPFYEKLTIHSPHSPQTLFDRLSHEVEARKLFRTRSLFSQPSVTPYEGTVSESGFKITRIINYRNSFLPVLRGRFIAEPPGTVVKITLSLHPAVAVLFVAFLGFWCSLSFALPLPSISPISSLSPSLIRHFQIVQLIVLPLVIFVVFKLEVRRSRRDLTRIFQ
jgi:hypothetical protein